MTYCASCNHTIASDASPRCRQCGTPRPAAGWPIDRRLNTTVAGHQYRVVRRLGTGGFGTVYEVETMARHHQELCATGFSESVRIGPAPRNAL